MSKWRKAQEWERNWHGQCLNTYGEEMKQLLYADRMGLVAFHDSKSPFNFDLLYKSILDIGGGPCSLLLKCVNFRYATVIDPILPPDWALDRYDAANIDFWKMCGEDLLLSEDEPWDEAWIYNCLQHVKNPQHVIEGARKKASLVRIFEWLHIPVSTGHLHTFSGKELDEWLEGEGRIEQFTGQANCKGTGYYGIFPT